MKKNAVQQQSANAELIKIFIRDAQKAAAILEAIHENKYRRTDDIQMYIINVHAMKSALANIGEKELSDKARKLEEAGREQDITLMTEETPAFLSALLAVIKKNKQDKNSINEDTENDDLVYLQEKLTVLEKACAEYDKKTAKDTLSQLQLKNWSVPIMELLKTMDEHLLHSEFEETMKLIEDYKNNHR